MVPGGSGEGGDAGRLGGNLTKRTAVREPRRSDGGPCWTLPSASRCSHPPPTWSTPYAPVLRISHSRISMPAKSTFCKLVVRCWRRGWASSRAWLGRGPRLPQMRRPLAECGATQAQATHHEQSLRHRPHSARPPHLPRVWAQLAAAPIGPGFGCETAHQWRSTALGSAGRWAHHLRRGSSVARDPGRGAGRDRDTAHPYRSRRHRTGRRAAGGHRPRRAHTGTAGELCPSRRTPRRWW